MKALAACRSPFFKLVSHNTVAVWYGIDKENTNIRAIWFFWRHFIKITF
jgi:hypothetical protein